MSYTIFYRAMFMRMSDGTYIPMIEMGDSNVWDVDRNRRSREWSSCRWMHESEEQRRLYSLAESEILGAAQREVDSRVERYAGTEPAFGGEKYTREDVLSNLGYFNGIHVSGRSITSASNFLNFIKSGIRNAVSWDDLKQTGCSLHLGWYEEGGNYRREYARDEDELREKWAGCYAAGITPWICFGEVLGDRLWDMVRSRNRKPRPERKQLTEYFVIRFNLRGADRYMVKLTSRNLRYNPYQDEAHKYTSRKVAERAAGSIYRRFPQISDIRVERVPA